ncbi:MAG: hypothetical protein ACTSSE_11585 [Candidatus Thorarchaeota archaeon]
MKNIVAYKSPGVEISHEPPSKLSRSQILFIVAFPLMPLFGGLLSVGITGSLAPLVSTNPLFSMLLGFGILVYVLLIPKVLRMYKGRTTLRDHHHTIDVDRVRPVSRTNI